MADKYPKVYAEKLLYLKNKNGSIYIKCPKINPVDTTSAGDILGGSAVSRLLKIGIAPAELTVERMYEVGIFASVDAGLSTEKFSGISASPRKGKRRNDWVFVINAGILRINSNQIQKGTVVKWRFYNSPLLYKENFT